ncbi:MAG: transglutaminase-like domain-containing protein [Candidatus Binatia bacterium]|nr:transglutaminase-like domain-containing protein [Candidatus Binatia bacterium]
MRTAGIVVVVAVWLGLLAALVGRQQPPTDAPLIALEDSPLSDPGRVQSDEWFGIYQDDRKIGWAHRSTTRGPNGLAFRDDSNLRLAMLGTEQQVQTSLVAKTDSEYALQGFRFRLVSPAATFSAVGDVTPERVHIEHGTGTAMNTLEIPLEEPIHLPTTLRSKLALWGAEPGARYGATVFSPLTMQNEILTVTVKGRETIDGPNGPIETVRIGETHQGIEATAWIAEDGSTIREEATLGFRLQREAPEVAVANIEGSAPVDLATENRIPLSGTIEQPREASHLRLAVGGEAAGRIPDDPPRQRIANGILEIERESLRGAAPGDHATMVEAAYTEPSAFIESEAPEIVAQALQIVGGETDPGRKARLLVDWVRGALTQEMSVTIPSARAVLESKTGDCNEHAVLLAALARATGIPTRVVAGVVYAEDGFYYHAWNELWLGRWVSADAIFGQFPADATHVKFLEGGPERHLELADIVGRLEFTKLENPS